MIYSGLIYLTALSLAAITGVLPWMIVLVYLAMSVIAFLIYGWDKSSAKNGRWRTPEKTLHLLSLVGGWPGALAGQRIFRHKTSKKSFQVVFWITVVINVFTTVLATSQSSWNQIGRILLDQL
jgi:uncharacterized membrane protein YsdA (DUF1294 family)